MTGKVINLREASGNDCIQITPEEALELAKDEPGLDKVLIIMVSEDKEMTWYQGGGMSLMEQLWYIERARICIVGPG